MRKNWSNMTQVRRGLGATMMIALLFLSSGALRIFLGASVASAQIDETNTSNEDPESKVENDGLAEMNPAANSTASMNTLLGKLKSRQVAVLEGERNLKMHEKTVQIAAKEVEKRITHLENLEKKLRNTLSLASGAAEGDLTQLTNVYENMKPKDAAALFETMDPPFAAGFLARMRPDSAAGIMAGLTPDKAYTISVILAGRNSRAPKS
jgi:flagellar motility protein MotE (MotC chaperone)